MFLSYHGADNGNKGQMSLLFLLVGGLGADSCLNSKTYVHTHICCLYDRGKFHLELNVVDINKHFQASNNDLVLNHRWFGPNRILCESDDSNILLVFLFCFFYKKSAFMLILSSQQNPPQLQFANFQIFSAAFLCDLIDWSYLVIYWHPIGWDSFRNTWRWKWQSVSKHRRNAEKHRT